MTGLADNSSTT